MSPKTRGRRAAAPSQTTLSFNSRTKVTKPSQHESATKKRLSDTVKDTIISGASEPEPEVANIDPEEEQEVKPTKPATEAPSAPAQPRKKKRISTTSTNDTDPREAAAEKVTDKQIKAYWQKEEDSRLAPRVHQKDVPLHEKILRHFDLSSSFGSCIGITRLARWKRANRLGLEPPVEVLAVLLREMDVGTTTTKAKKGTTVGAGGSGRSQGCSMVAYIDELGGGGGRLGVVDA